MKGQLTRDEDGDLWMYIAPHHTGYWKFVDADDNWVGRGMALQVTGDAASLFEAAPELLATLRIAADALDYAQAQVDSENDRHNLLVRLEQVKRAISKAEGRAD